MPFPVLDACLYLYASEKLSPAEVALALRTAFPEIPGGAAGPPGPGRFAALFTRSIYKWVQSPLALHVGSLDLDRERALQLPVVQRQRVAGGLMEQALPAGRLPATSRTTGRRVTSYAAVVLGCLLVAPWMARSGWVGNVYIHMLHETTAVLLALGVAAIALVRFHSRKSDTFLLLGAAFAGVAFLDGYHALTTSAFFAEHFQASDSPRPARGAGSPRGSSSPSSCG